MTYVKANIDETTHKKLRIKAAEQNTTIEDITAGLLETHPELNDE